MSAWRNPGHIRCFNDVSFAPERVRPDLAKQDANIHELLVKLGKRPLDPTPHIEVCPKCHSRNIAQAPKRDRCKACGTEFPRGLPASSEPAEETSA